MHTLAVLSHTNCFSLRQISCKSRLRRQHCPGPPGRRDGRQADGAGGGGGGGGGSEWSVYQGRLGAGWRRKEGGGGVPRRKQRSEEREREKSSNTSECPSLCLSMVRAESPPTSYSPYPLKPSLQLSDLCSALCLPLLSLSHSLTIAPQKSGGKMKLYKEGEKSITQMDRWITGSGMLRR